MTHKPFEFSLGPRNAKLAFVAESWGEREDMFKAPLVGWSGVELGRMLNETGLTQHFNFPYQFTMEQFMIGHWLSTGYLFTNVFAERPANNDVENWCVKKTELPDVYQAKYFRPGKYFKPEVLDHVDRLQAELLEAKPNLVVALGAAATWALLGAANIGQLRGTVAWSEFAKCKVLPTYHPAHVLRQWQTRTIVLQDLLKVKREMEFPDIRRPSRKITYYPTLEDIREWSTRPATHYAVDIETSDRMISIVGFARSPSDAIVIPFALDGQSYWKTEEEELQAWLLVKFLLEGPQVKIFQNGLYDLSHLVRKGIRPRNCVEDTMLLHHSLFPELLKGLGFLGSIYTDEASWKLRHSTSSKREE